MSSPPIKFEWDPAKAAANERKHRITFDRATRIFQDPEALTIYDRNHSDAEDRWITIGMDAIGSIVVVSHAWRAEENDAFRCRIISARKATANEIRSYQRML